MRGEVGQDAREAVNDGLQNLSEAMSAAWQGLAEWADQAKQFCYQTARADNDLLGEYTFPIEREFFESVPPSIGDNSCLGRFVVSPFTLFHIGLTLTFIPLIGNSIQYTPWAFTQGYNLFAHSFLANDWQMADRVGPNALRGFYALPGIITFGLLGLVIGGGFSAIRGGYHVVCAAIDGGGWWLKHCGITTAQTFRAIYNASLSAGSEHRWDEAAGDHWLNQNRSWGQRIASSPGLILGGLAGLVVGGIVLGIRLAGVAIEGLVLGACAVAAGLAWWGTQLGITIAQTFRAIYNASLSANSEYRWDEAAADHWLNADRSWGKRIAGSPGLIVGGLAGLVVGGIVLGIRAGCAVIEGGVWWLKHLAITSGQTFRAIYNASLSDGSEYRWDEAAADHWLNADRSWGKRIAGSPGLIIGGLAGLVVGGIVLGIRLAGIVIEGLVLGACAVAAGLAWWGTQLGITIAQTFRELYNASLSAGSEYRWDEAAVDHWLNQNRSWGQRIMGSPGLIIGGVAGLVVGGIVLGIRAGCAVIEGGVWWLKHCGITTAQTFRAIYNASLSAGSEYRWTENDAHHWLNENRSWGQRIMGSPGLIIGGIAGILVGAGALVIRLGVWVIDQAIIGLTAIKDYAKHCGQSWISLSGSLMNVAIGQPFFAGLNGDQRTVKQKLFSLPGYVLALATTLPFAALVWVSRLSIFEIGPVLGAIVTGFAFLTFIYTPYKLVLQPVGNALSCFFKALCCCCRPRRRVQPFGGDEAKVREATLGDIKQKFNNIYSHLDWTGRLKLGEIAKDGDGEMSWGSFFRKCFTYNSKTITERALNNLLSAFKVYISDQPGSTYADFINSVHFGDAVQKTKDFYSQPGCGIPGTVGVEGKADDRRLKRTLKEIDDVVNLVKAYLNPVYAVDYEVKQAGVVPVGFYQPRIPDPSLEDCFWGPKPSAPPAPPEDKDEWQSEDTVVSRTSFSDSSSSVYREADRRSFSSEGPGELFPQPYPSAPPAPGYDY